MCYTYIYIYVIHKHTFTRTNIERYIDKKINLVFHGKTFCTFCDTQWMGFDEDSMDPKFIIDGHMVFSGTLLCR